MDTHSAAAGAPPVGIGRSFPVDLVDQVPDYPFLNFERQELDPRLDEARERGELLRVRLPYAGEAWLATTYAHVRQVLTDPRFSRAAAMGPDIPRQTPEPPFVRTIMDVDRPEHSRLRRLVAPAFAERRIDGLRPYVRTVAHRLIDDMLKAGSPADLIQALALPLPLTVFCRTLGVPLADRDRFGQWTQALVSLRRITAEEFRAVAEALEGYLRELIRRRRAEPTDDLLSALVSARDDGDQLTEQELVSIGVTLLAAGYESTAGHIAGSVYLLLSRDLWSDLSTQGEELERTVAELLRFVPLNGGTGLPRVALEDVRLGRVTVRAGEAVFVSTIAANRDSRAFPEGDEFDPHRKPGLPHLAFGWGPHRCLGARLATMELHETLAALRERLPTLRLAVPARTIRWKTGTILRCPRALPVTW